MGQHAFGKQRCCNPDFYRVETRRTAVVAMPIAERVRSWMKCRQPRHALLQKPCQEQLDNAHTK